MVSAVSATDDLPTRRETALLAGDAALFSAVFVFAAPASLLLGPVAAWLLHRRRLDRTVVVSGLLGLLGALVSIGIVVGAFSLYARFSGRFDPLDVSGGIALLAVFGAVFSGVVLALVVDAVRDLLPGRRAHVWLDIARLLSAITLVVGSVVIAKVQIANPTSEIGDVGPFALLFAVLGALTVLYGRALRYRVGAVVGRRSPQER